MTPSQQDPLRSQGLAQASGLLFSNHRTDKDVLTADTKTSPILWGTNSKSTVQCLHLKHLFNKNAYLPGD